MQQLVIVGRVLGVLSIERHVMDLDRANQLEVMAAHGVFVPPITGWEQTWRAPACRRPDPRCAGRH